MNNHQTLAAKIKNAHFLGIYYVLLYITLNNTYTMKTIIIVFAFIAITSLALCQEVLSTGGDFHQTPQGSLSFTIGEPISETFDAGENVLTQGFQQTKLIITAIETPEMENFKLHIFPNPTHSTILIETTDDVQQSMQFALYDLNGKILYNICSDQSILEIDLTSFSPGTYLLRISNDNQQMNTYKIIKN